MRGKGAKISKKLILDDVCGVQENSFKNKRIFQNHYRTHGEEKFQCSECPAIWSEGPETIFNTKKQLITHMFEYHNNSKDCKEYDQSFSHASNLKKHEDSHETILECQHCKKMYMNRYSFKQHVIQCSSLKNTTSESFQCTECEKCFSKLAVLKNHIKTHTVQNTLSCEKCEKSFTNSFTLKRHMGKCNSTNKEPCSVCHKVISVENIRRQIETQHKVQGPTKEDYILVDVKKNTTNLSCTICNITFKHKPSLIRHNKKVHPKTEEKNTITYNDMVYSLENPEVAVNDASFIIDSCHSCDKCAKSFSTNKKLWAHIRKTHQSKPQYKCDECENTYTRHLSLKVHIKTIHKNEMSTCEHCLKSFRNGNSFKRHIKTMHRTPKRVQPQNKDYSTVSKSTKWRKTNKILKENPSLFFNSEIRSSVLKKTCSQQEIEKEESRKLSINDVIDRTVQSNFTDRQAIGMMQTVRKNFGKNSVQANAMVETGRNKEKGSKFFY